jgi:DNA-directed RNA polymerase subunit beta'
MFSRVKIVDPGDSDFVIGEIVEKDMFLEENKRLKAEGKKLAKGVLLLMGIKNVASTAYSFLSAASFQETARALVRAALECREDVLRGIKENIIIGRKAINWRGISRMAQKKSGQVQPEEEQILSQNI